MNPRVALVNDTSLFQRHFGCQLVGQTFREQLARVGLDLVLALPKDFEAGDYERTLGEVELVVINGEGSIHHGRNLHLIALAERFPCALVNCVYEANPSAAGLERLLYAAARESLSAAELQKNGVQCDVVPDLLFASAMVGSFPRREPLLEVGVTDNVARVGRRRLFGLRRAKYDIDARSGTPAEVLARIAQYRRLCVGRFHIAVVCARFGIPFSTWDSNTWKTRGLMLDMGVPHLHFERREEALANLPDTPDPQIGAFAMEARRRVASMFEKLRDLAEGRAK